MTEDKMVEWHNLLNGHESEQILGDGRGQRSLAATVHGVAESDTIQQLNKNNQGIQWGKDSLFNKWG